MSEMLEVEKVVMDNNVDVAHNVVKDYFVR
jgi:hypothetical protein